MRRRSRGVLGVLTAATLLGASACGGEAAAPACPSDGCVLGDVTTVTYAEDSVTQVMDVYAPEAKGPWPAVIIAHGANLDRSTVASWATGIAEQGAVAFLVGYPTGRAPESVAYGDAVRSLTCATRVVRDIAADYGGDAGRVVAVGHSLGADILATVALGAEDVSPTCVVGGGTTHIDAFVGYEGPYGLGSADYPSGTLLDPGAQTGRDVSSPYELIGNNPDLVLRVAHGDRPDTQWYEIPATVSQRFVDALVEAGYDANLVVVEGGEHSDIGVGTAPHAAVVEQAVALARE